MNPAIPLADPLPLPAPPALLWGLLQATFLLHVLAMNGVLGGSLLALHWRLAHREDDAPERAQMLHLFSRALPLLVAATVTFGVAPLLFLQVVYGRIFFTSAILMAWLWLAIVPLVILAYGGAYRLAFGGQSRWWATAVPVLLAAVAFLQVTNASRGLRPETFADVYRRDARGLALNLSDPSFWPRYLHVLLGAFAIAALGVALVGLFERRRRPALAAWALRRGMTLFTAASAANVFVGMLFLITLPRQVLARLVGGDTRAMSLLAAAILLGIAVTGSALLTLGTQTSGRATAATATLLMSTLVTMLLLREEVRRIVLRNAGFELPTWVAAQWGAFGLFAACALAATVTIGWMVRALRRGRPV